MNNGIRLTVILLLIVGINISAQTNETRYVDPFIGTGGHGHTYPGATLPHGMVQLSPDNGTEGWDWCSGYHYSDSTIMGFSHTHLSGTGIGDYGDILFMPTTGAVKTVPGPKTDPDSGYSSRFSHKDEHASPGYYSVILKDYKIKAELTATDHAGFQRYTFPATEEANVIIDLNHGIQDKTTGSEIKIINKKTIEGYRRSTGWAKDEIVYFYAEFSKPFESYGIAENDKQFPDKSFAEGKDIQAFVRYSTSAGEKILIKVGISFVSIEGAKKNLTAEIPGWDFDGIRQLAEEKWNKALSVISVESKSKKDKTIFYTALYHALLTPNVFSDVDGKYMGMDRKIHTVAKGHEMYTVFSLWDTFRAEQPLFTIIEKKRDIDMVRSLIAKYKSGGELPVWELAANETWTMIGYHSVPVITDAYFKGLRDFNVEEAYKAMKNSAMQDKNGLKYYKEMGYIPADLENESVSKTLEYAYDDWCIAKMAKALGKEKDYKYFINRAKFFENVFDPSTCLMRAKKNGEWVKPFDPYSVSGNYTEANAWQYSFFVPQDVDGLINLMGGDAKFLSMLDELFDTKPKLTGRDQADITGMIGQYAQGNEPSHHMAYLYNYAGEPWKTQGRVHQIVTKLYTDSTDGLCGNDDCGQMSAWYVFSAMGFYPVCPGDNTYIIGTPLFDKVVINTGGKKFVITADGVSSKDFYIKSAELDGKAYPYSYIKNSDIEHGGSLVFKMASEPSNWGTSQESRPVSEINTSFVTVPYLTEGDRVFKDSTLVGLSSIQDSVKIFYTLDGGDPAAGGKLYSSPLVIKKTSELKAVSLKNGIYSKTITSKFNKTIEGMSIKLNTRYSNLYPGGGPLCLIDGIRGTDNFHTSAWQGYHGDNLDAVIDLSKIKKINSIDASFLQDTHSWIFYPSEIDYFVSFDGKNFKLVYQIKNIDDKEHSAPGIKDYKKELKGIKARYIRVLAKNVGVCPPWHVSAGGKAWLFVDEISVK